VSLDLGYFIQFSPQIIATAKKIWSIVSLVRNTFPFLGGFSITSVRPRFFLSSSFTFLSLNLGLLMWRSSFLFLSMRAYHHRHDTRHPRFCSPPLPPIFLYLSMLSFRRQTLINAILFSYHRNRSWPTRRLIDWTSVSEANTDSGKRLDLVHLVCCNDTLFRSAS
jgi:hypothetical protein